MEEQSNRGGFEMKLYEAESLTCLHELMYGFMEESKRKKFRDKLEKE